MGGKDGGAPLFPGMPVFFLSVRLSRSPSLLSWSPLPPLAPRFPKRVADSGWEKALRDVNSLEDTRGSPRSCSTQKSKEVNSGRQQQVGAAGVGGCD